MAFQLLCLSQDLIDRAAYCIRKGVEDENHQTELVRALGVASGTIFIDVLNRIREAHPDLAAAGYPDKDDLTGAKDH